MPSLHAPVPRPAARVTIERRPGDAIPDFGDRNMPGYQPGVTSRRMIQRGAGDRPRPVAPGRPVRLYMHHLTCPGPGCPLCADPGITRAAYRGTGHDQAGGCRCGKPGCPLAPRMGRPPAGAPR